MKIRMSATLLEMSCFIDPLLHPLLEEVCCFGTNFCGFHLSHLEEVLNVSII